jgi:hypothetical protein
LAMSFMNQITFLFSIHVSFPCSTTDTTQH